MFSTQYQENINYRLNQIFYGHWDSLMEHLDVRLEIMATHVILTFLPITEMTIYFIGTSFQSLAINLLSLFILPFFIVGNFLDLIFLGRLDAIPEALFNILNAATTALIIAIEIAACVLSFATKPLITLGFIIGYAGNYLISLLSSALAQIPNVAAPNNPQAEELAAPNNPQAAHNPRELDALLLRCTHNATGDFKRTLGY